MGNNKHLIVAVSGIGLKRSDGVQSHAQIRARFGGLFPYVSLVLQSCKCSLKTGISILHEQVPKCVSQKNTSTTGSGLHPE